MLVDYKMTAEPTRPINKVPDERQSMALDAFNKVMEKERIKK